MSDDWKNRTYEEIARDIADTARRMTAKQSETGNTVAKQYPELFVKKAERNIEQTYAAWLAGELEGKTGNRDPSENGPVLWAVPPIGMCIKHLWREAKSASFAVAVSGVRGLIAARKEAVLTEIRKRSAIIPWEEARALVGGYPHGYSAELLASVCDDCRARMVENGIIGG